MLRSRYSKRDSSPTRIYLTDDPRGRPARRRLTNLTAVLSLLALITLTYILFASFSDNNPPTSETDPRLAWLDDDSQPSKPRVVEREKPLVVKSVVHKWRADGLVTPSEHAQTNPIYECISRSRFLWESILDSRGGDMETALRVFRHREDGLEFVEESMHFDRMVADHLSLYEYIPSELLSKRQAETENLPGTFTLIVRRGRPSIYFPPPSSEIKDGSRLSPDRGQEEAAILTTFVKPLTKKLANVRATFSFSKFPRHVIPFETYDLFALERPLVEDEVLAHEGLMRHPSWTLTGGCAEERKGQYSADDAKKAVNPELSEIRLVHSLPRASDPCIHTYLSELHSIFEDAEDGLHIRLYPILSQHSSPWSFDIVVPPLGLFNTTSQVKYIPFAERNPGLFWRRPKPKNATHPSQRLYNLLRNPKQPRRLLDPTPTQDRAFTKVIKPVSAYLPVDIDFSHYANPNFDDRKFKFAIELDEAVRFRQMLLSGCLVFRPVIISDWVTDRAIPWIHYVPVQPNLVDLPTLLAFFSANDKLAEEIASAGREWALDMLSDDLARRDWERTLMHLSHMQAKMV
ncbi:hypothetical protein SISNIDRAFT_451692 [Sistotremastrum niveocremeum HHB9708]|uniref:Glycosyl transferase CAP10 domain-containing protein n=1 Tax=Sistotremastrum niveocremeum HHB9708 TaxID=1314777 RepID=A0A164XJ04_9AGAM|nr:hypothetical protein SISNIDRAFT_451692 [Sistotremastrum niveocremeum HHB9708]